MKLGQRILLFYFLILGLLGWFVLDLVFDRVKPLVRQSAEETLVDAANLLAEMVAVEAKDGAVVVTPQLREALNRYAGRTPDPKNAIYSNLYPENER